MYISLNKQLNFKWPPITIKATMCLNVKLKNTLRFGFVFRFARILSNKTIYMNIGRLKFIA